VCATSGEPSPLVASVRQPNPRPTCLPASPFGSACLAQPNTPSHPRLWACCCQCSTGSCSSMCSADRRARPTHIIPQASHFLLPVAGPPQPAAMFAVPHPRWSTAKTQAGFSRARVTPDEPRRTITITKRTKKDQIKTQAGLAVYFSGWERGDGRTPGGALGRKVGCGGEGPQPPPGAAERGVQA